MFCNNNLNLLKLGITNKFLLNTYKSVLGTHQMLH